MNMKKFQKKIIATTIQHTKIKQPKVKPLETLLDQYTTNGEHLPPDDRLLAFVSLVLTNAGIQEIDAYDILYHIRNSSLILK